MANTKFFAAKAYMPGSIHNETNGIWDIELYMTRFGWPEFRFAREYWSSFATLWDDGLWHFSVDGAGIPPKYVMDRAVKTWMANVG